MHQMKVSRSTEQLSKKLGEVIKQFKVSVEGPLWYDILHIAQKKMMSLQELVINRAFIKELIPLITLTKALAWDSIGSVMLKKVNLVNVLKIHGKQSLGNK